MTDARAQLGTKYSQLSAMLIGQESVFTPQHWNKYNIHVTEETTVLSPTRDNAEWGRKIVFTQPKRATGTMSYLLRLEIGSSGSRTGGTGAGLGLVATGAAATAAYVNNLGDQVCANVVHRYGSSILQEYTGEFAQIYQRVNVNEVNEEGRNALTLGGLPLAANNSVPEQQRHVALRDGLVLYVPLDRLWFCQNHDEMWMAEAYSTEGEIEIELARIEDVVYNAIAADPRPSPFNSALDIPPILSAQLIAREVTLTVPEKMARLEYYETDRGMLCRFLDIEHQARIFNGNGGAGNRELRVDLDNIRLDSVELYFMIRRVRGSVANTAHGGIDEDYAGDNLQGPVFDFSTVATTGPVAQGSQLGGVAGVQRIDMLDDTLVNYRLEANGKRLYDNQNELVGRAWVRKFYHSDSQPRSPVHIISFSLYPSDTKNSTGFQNFANLGKATLVLTLPDWATGESKQVDVFSHSNNIIVSRRGDVVKSLK